MSFRNPLLLPGWRAMVLAAGFGTRLKPMTDRIPKPLVPVAGVPMLALTLTRLRKLKPETLVVNGHHLSSQLEVFLEKSGAGFQRLKYLYEPLILDIGGALRNASHYLRGPFFVTTNADVATNIPLRSALVQHLKRGSLVTMLLHDRERYNQVEVDFSGRIRGFGSLRPDFGNRLLAYTGMQICSPRLLDLMAREAPGRPFSLIAFYRRLLAAGRLDIVSHMVDTQDQYYWRDLGTPEDIIAMEMDLNSNRSLAGSLGIV